MAYRLEARIDEAISHEHIRPIHIRGLICHGLHRSAVDTRMGMATMGNATIPESPYSLSLSNWFRFCNSVRRPRVFRNRLRANP